MNAQMLDEIAIAALAVVWIACVFAMLQLVELRAWAAIGGLTSSIVVGLIVLATRDQGIGLDWIRSASLRSDAYALGALPAMVATNAGVLVSRSARRSIWGPTAAAVAGLGCAAGGIVALAIGRSGWYWEFVAVVAAGAILATIGVLTALRRDAPAEMRLAFGCIAAFGTFLLGGGVLLFVAWRTIA